MYIQKCQYKLLCQSRANQVKISWIKKFKIWTVRSLCFSFNVGESQPNQELLLASEERANEPKLLQIFPNPVDEKLFIAPLSKIPEEVQILDALGKMVLEVRNSNEIDVSALRPGIFFVIIKEDGSIITDKIIKK